MTIITNIDGTTFEINGIKYYKNFISLVAGNNLRIVDVYDVRLELAPFDDYSQYTVNGNTYGNVADLQEALLPVLFTRASLNGIVVDGDIVDVELVGDTLTFVLADMSVINIVLPYVRTVTGTAVDDTDPRNVIIDKYANETKTFSVDLTSATITEDILNVAITAINSTAPYSLDETGQQAVFYFDLVNGSFIQRYYFRETTGVTPIASVNSNTLIADGLTQIPLSNYEIALGDIGASNIEDAFNSDPSEPFAISGVTFITATQSSVDKVWVWNGGDGSFGDSATPATANDFILLKDGSSVIGTVSWGTIIGTLSDQADLQDELDDKANLSGGNSFDGDQNIDGQVNIGNAVGTRPLSVFKDSDGSVATFLSYTDGSNFQGLYINVSQATNIVEFLSAGSSSGSFSWKSGTTERMTLSTGGALTAVSFSGSGTGLTNVDAVTLDSLDSTDFVRSTGSVTEDVTGAKTFTNDDTSFGTEGQVNTITILGDTGEDVTITKNLDGTVAFENTNNESFVFEGGLDVNAGASVIFITSSNAAPLRIDNDSGSGTGIRFADTGGNSDLVFDSSSGFNLDNDTVVNGVLTAEQFKLSALNTAPSSASDTGAFGEIRIDADYIYVCTAVDTWKRVAISTW